MDEHLNEQYTLFIIIEVYLVEPELLSPIALDLLWCP